MGELGAGLWAAGLGEQRLLDVGPGDALSELPHPDDSFDAVVCLQGIEAASEPRRPLSELARVLAPGGVLLVTLPAGSEVEAALRRTFPDAQRLGQRTWIDAGALERQRVRIQELTAMLDERAELRARLVESEAQAARVLELEAELAEAGRRYGDLQRQLETTSEILDDVLESPSWRLTKPVRELRARLTARRR